MTHGQLIAARACHLSVVRSSEIGLTRTPGTVADVPRGVEQRRKRVGEKYAATLDSIIKKWEQRVSATLCFHCSFTFMESGCGCR